MKTKQLLAAILAATPFAKAYLTQGKTVTMSSHEDLLSNPDSNAVDNNYDTLSITDYE